MYAYVFVNACMYYNYITYNLQSFIFIHTSVGIATTTTMLPCGDDNLSCPRADNVTQCFSRSDLCNLVTVCPDGADEGLPVSSNLECTFQK